MKFVTQRSAKLIDFLAKELSNSSKSKVKKLIKDGVVYLDGEKVLQTKTMISEGQTVEINKGGKQTAKAAVEKTKPLPYKILWEDDTIIALGKTAGVNTVSSTKDKNTVYHHLKTYLNGKPATLVNYIGRQVSGILLFYKGEVLPENLQREQLEIKYCALVEGRLKEESGTVSNYLKVSEAGKVHEANEETGVLATTNFRTLKDYAKHQLLEIEKPTHIKGQIRVHLSNLDCPVVGDKKYGATKNPFNRIALHLFSLNFKHPVTNEAIKLTYPTPNEFILYGRGRS